MKPSIIAAVFALSLFLRHDSGTNNSTEELRALCFDAKQANGALKIQSSRNDTNAVIVNGDSLGSRVTQEDATTLLTLHNQFRAEVGVGPLHWSPELAKYAQAWADHLAKTKCSLEHRPVSGKWQQRHGENLFMGTAGAYGVGDAVKSWESEKKIFRGEKLKQSNWYAAGHYMQVIWRNTKRVGCATVECEGNLIVVCNYDPAGNVLGERPY